MNRPCPSLRQSFGVPGGALQSQSRSCLQVTTLVVAGPSG